MTVLAWDGATLAADRRSVNGGLISPVTKIFRLKSGELFGCCGTLSACLQVKHWYEHNQAPDTFPMMQRDKDDWEVCLIIGLDRSIKIYERTPFPITIEREFHACGSGRDFAIAAMHLGKTAAQAVEIASLYESGCGDGIDALQL